MLRTIDPTDAATTARIVEIQRAAYAVEAALMGFDGIPQLTETAGHVHDLGHLHWTGAFVDDLLVGLIAWEQHGQDVEIDRLAVDPLFARQGHGRRLVQSVPAVVTTIVSTGQANEPAITLYRAEGFEQTGSLEIAPEIRIAQFRRSG